MRKNLMTLLSLFAFLSLMSCSKQEPVTDSLVGNQKTEEELSSAARIYFRPVESSGNSVSVNLPEGGSFTSVEVHALSDKELRLSQTMVVSVDSSLVSAYNSSRKTDCKILPEAFYSIDNGGVVTIPAGAKESDAKLVRIYATNPIGNVLEAGEYVLPLKASEGGAVYIAVTIQAVFSGRPPLYEGDDCFTVFYLNTSQFDPRLVTDFVVEKTNSMMERVWYNSIGNIVNFRGVTIGYDKAANLPRLTLSSDMKYLVGNFDTYFRPVQETGRKMCVCIEGGGTGLGFCNLTDSQIEDFVSQVKRFVDQYGFDGVNLWDRNSGYGKDGMPEMNTTSYPKLIKALREALGPYKLLTIADYAEPTEYFWDSEATGGIEVGQYLDYAWSGYVDGSEPIQIIDPYHQGNEYVSAKYPRKPIAGLSAKRYGCVHTTWYKWSDCGYDAVAAWVASGLKQSNISVYYDIRSNLQDQFEGQIYTPQDLLQYLDDTYLTDTSKHSTYTFVVWNFRTGGSGYGKWLKDW